MNAFLKSEVKSYKRRHSRSLSDWNCGKNEINHCIFLLCQKSEVCPERHLSRFTILPQKITIDGRGMTIQEAITEMWARIQPLTDRGYNPVSGVEIVDNKSKEIIQTFQINDPDFRNHIVEDKNAHRVQ